MMIINSVQTKEMIPAANSLVNSLVKADFIFKTSMKNNEDAENYVLPMMIVNYKKGVEELKDSLCVWTALPKTIEMGEVSQEEKSIALYLSDLVYMTRKQPSKVTKKTAISTETFPSYDNKEEIINILEINNKTKPNFRQLLEGPVKTMEKTNWEYHKGNLIIPAGTAIINIADLVKTDDTKNKLFEDPFSVMKPNAFNLYFGNDATRLLTGIVTGKYK